MTGAARGARISFTTSIFPDVYIDSFAPHRPPARGHGGGAVFPRRERTIAHGHARTARFGGASGHSRGRISAPARCGFATICPLAPPMVGGLGGAIAAPDAGAGTRGNFDSPRQSTRRFFGLCANWPRGVSPSPGGECGDVPPLDACAPPSAASAADPGGGLRVSRAPDPPTLRVAASLTGLPPVALGLFPVTPMPLALACFCLGQNVCFIPRKKLHLLV